MAPRP